MADNIAIILVDLLLVLIIFVDFGALIVFVAVSFLCYDCFWVML